MLHSVVITLWSSRPSKKHVKAMAFGNKPLKQTAKLSFILLIITIRVNTADLELKVMCVLATIWPAPPKKWNQGKIKF